jgi:hypothetical protein
MPDPDPGQYDAVTAFEQVELPVRQTTYVSVGPPRSPVASVYVLLDVVATIAPLR